MKSDHAIFYRNYIDPDFDINYIPPEGETQETEYAPPPEVTKKNLKKMKKENKKNDGEEKNKDSDEEENEEISSYDKLLDKYELSKKIANL